MKRIVLIRPKNDVSALGVPLGLLRIGTMLECAGYEVHVVDLQKDDNLEGLLPEALLVGVTCLTSEVRSAIEVSDYIKRKSDVPIVWGGCHPSLFPQETCMDKSVDYVCVGEGDKTVVELATAIENKTSVNEIAGLGYKRGNEAIVNPIKNYVDLEELPPINYDLVDVKSYIKKSIPYQSSRGCPHRCGFCVNPATNNRKYRAKSPAKVSSEIADLVDKYGVNRIDFYDDNFFVDINRVSEIARLIKFYDVSWFAECRIDYFREGFVDRRLLKLCEQSGLSELTLGAESGSQKILDSINKDITIGQIFHSASELSHFSIIPNYSFIVGLPDETKQQQMMTVELARQVYRVCPTSRCPFVTYTPYPKTAITDKLVEKGLVQLPSTLRGWLDDNVRKLYYDRFSSKPWHDDKEFIDNLVHYARVAYSIYTSGEISLLNILKRPFRFRALPFVLLAQFRMKHLWFSLPIDISLFILMERLNKVVTK